jgi:hypothetical protein
MDFTYPLPKHESTNDGFVYDVRVTSECPLLKNHFAKFNEMAISSNWFSDDNECIQDAINMLTAFAKKLRPLTGRKYMIATKLNPLHDDEYDKEIDVNEWDEPTVLKMFLADTEILKEELRIETSVYAIVKVSPKINLAQAQANLIPQ